MKIARAIQTCAACPSQWDAWTTDGQYLYLRYRSGIGTVEAQPGPDLDTWDDAEPVAKFGDPSMNGSITLAEFCAAAGLELSETAEVTRLWPRAQWAEPDCICPWPWPGDGHLLPDCPHYDPQKPSPLAVQYSPYSRWRTQAHGKQHQQRRAQP